METPVRRVFAHDSEVEVRSDSDVFRGRYLVVTIPPPLVGQITWRPPLPEANLQLAQKMKMGEIIKCIVVYESPFWRDVELSGMMITDEGPLESTLEGAIRSGERVAEEVLHRLANQPKRRQ